MREISGYVFIAGFERQMGRVEELFGPSPQKERAYANLSGNRFLLYSGVKEVKNAIREYRKVMKAEEPQLTPALLWMRIADDYQEAKKVFAKSRDLIVIASAPEAGGPGDILMGRRVDGKPEQYPLYGARMTLNGFATIQRWDNASYIGSEAARQGQFHVRFARFKLKRLPT